MTKDEKIKEALGLSEPWSLDSVIEKLSEASNILLHRYNYDGIHWEEISHCVEKSNCYRKRLEEVQILLIENNNGWIKIESGADLPRNDSEYKVGTMVGSKFYLSKGVYEKDEVTRSWYSNNITHYQPIQKPQPPIH